MAVWQFTLDPIPAEKGDQIIHDDDSRRELALSARQLSSLFFRLSAILPPGRGWDEDMRLWGDEQGDDISFFMSDAGVESMQIRIDVRNLSTPLIEAICKLAQDYGWAFASDGGEIVQPTVESVLNAIIASPAYEYARDPKGFIARTGRNRNRTN